MSEPAAKRGAGAAPRMQRDEVACVILGSSFATGDDALGLAPLEIETPFGPTTLHRVSLPAASGGRAAYALFRHGLPWRLLPHQIPYRANAWALREVGCTALLVTSSVGVMDDAVPLFEPLLVADLVALDNRLPDGSPCTIFVDPSPTQGHLVVRGGLFSAALGATVRSLAGEVGVTVAAGEVVFAYVPGPRTKTRAENALLARGGVCQVNSMTLAPEIILANELEIPCAALVVGHKRSSGAPRTSESVDYDAETIDASLVRARGSLARVVTAFFERAVGPTFDNHIHRVGR